MSFTRFDVCLLCGCARAQVCTCFTAPVRVAMCALHLCKWYLSVFRNENDERDEDGTSVTFSGG